MRLSIDELIELLQQKKAEGVPGTTPVGLDTPSDRYKYINMDIQVGVTSVSKPDFEKGWSLATRVTRAGVPVVVITAA